MSENIQALVDGLAALEKAVTATAQSVTRDVNVLHQSVKTLAERVTHVERRVSAIEHGSLVDDASPRSARLRIERALDEIHDALGELAREKADAG